MNKKFFLAVLAVCAACFLAGAVPVYAQDILTETYKPITGDKVTLSHELVVDKKATTVHDATFTFSIAGADVTTNNPPYFKKGPEGAVITESLTYSDADVSGATADGNSGKKTVKKDIEVDFSNVKFTDVGIYRFAVTQHLEKGSHIVTDENTHYIDVTVIDDLNNKAEELKIESVLFSTSLNTSTSKTDHFFNSYTANKLTVSKKVEGNQGSRNKYFKFTVQLKKTDGESGGSAGAPSIDLSELDSNLSSVTPATVYSVDTINSANGAAVTWASLAAGQDFYLKDAQRIVFSDIPAGYGYTVTEDPEEDYQPSVTVTGDTDYEDKSDSHVNDQLLTAYTTLAFTNTRQADVSTGVVLAVAVPALLLLTGVVGAGVILSRKRKELR